MSGNPFTGSGSDADRLARAGIDRAQRTAERARDEDIEVSGPRRFYIMSPNGTKYQLSAVDTAGITLTDPAGTVTAMGSVGSVSVVTTNGISGTVATPTTAPAITLTLGAITPSSVAATGAITSSGATSGVGYVTGAGGTVTQATSKTTPVTLNKVSGQITLNGSSIAAGATVGFPLNNSTIAATDVLIVNIASGATANSYAIQVESVSAGQAVIRIRNTGAGALADTLVLNFAVIKAVNA